jgi:hypothetical protein
VELFTSEGCSSCPPADSLLAELEKRQPIHGVEVIALEEHVDYWNRLGWTDPFSSAEFTSRQESYAQVLGNDGVYTPQMIVNGRRELVGSRGHELSKALEEATGQPHANVAIKMEKTATADSQHLAVSVGGLVAAAPGNTIEVWLAITEKQLHSAVTRGENAGEDLHHASVVRTLRKIGVANGNDDPSFSTALSVRLESSWTRENLRVVVFLQENKSRKVLGAASAPVDAL